MIDEGFGQQLNSTDENRLNQQNSSFSTIQLGLEWFPERGGGLDRYYYELLRYLPQVGIKTRGLVVGSPKVVQDSQGQVVACAAHSAPLIARWQGMRRAVKDILTPEDCSVIVSHFPLYTFPVLDLIRDCPLVIHFHGPWAQESQLEGSGRVATIARSLLEKTVYQRGTRFIVLSYAFRQILHQSYGIPAERIEVVRGGVEVARFTPTGSRSQAREYLGLSPNRPTVLAVRRLARRMGLDNLITAIGQVRQTIPDILLMVAGKGPLAETLLAQVRSLGLENNVQLLGFVPDTDLPLTYRAADLTVVPTVALEGFGLIAVESLAAGTPVMVTPIGGLPEVVSGLSTELVLTDSTVTSLAEGIKAALLGKMSLPDAEACHSYACQYDWLAIAAQVGQVYYNSVFRQN